MLKPIDDPYDGSLVFCLSYLLFFSQGCFWVMVSETCGVERDFFYLVRSSGIAVWWCWCQRICEDLGWVAAAASSCISSSAAWRRRRVTGSCGV